MATFEEASGVQSGFGVKAVFYGQEGVGKSTLAAQIPDAVFIDIEGSTSRMNVRRLKKPTSWQMLCDELDYVLHTRAQKGWNTVVIDTFDWAERLAIDALCAKYNVDGVEGMNYGKGWQYEAEMIGRFLDKTDVLIANGMNVVLLCHATTRKVTLPEEVDEYDHWELKLGNKTTNKIAPLLKEWSDLTLFLAFKTNVIATDDKGKKHKATGTQRVMYTTKTAWWDAKNRFGLPDELPLQYDVIAHIFQPAQSAPQRTQQSPDPPRNGADMMLARAQSEGIPAAILQDTKPVESLPRERDYRGALHDLMQTSGITEEQLLHYSSDICGYFPRDTPFAALPEDYIAYLTANWQSVVQALA